MCDNCGSNDLYEENGYMICRYCGSRYLLTKDDKPDSQASIDLSGDVKALLAKWDNDSKNADRYARLILEIDPSNERAKRQLYGKNNQSSGKSSGGCYIATAVYGSYDCPQVWTLRRYRDYVLARSVPGRMFIKLYYAVSPTIVKYFGKTGWFIHFSKTKLDRFVLKLNKQGIEDTEYTDL